MAHKAKLVLSNEVYKQIKWLTHNFDKEIGAFGIGKTRTKEGESYMYVEKLFFPKQKTTSATVHITNEMWADLLKNNEFLERMGDLCFYWHRHPGGSAHHSSTDEEDTFNTIMDTAAKRKWFAFLQTASKSDGSMDKEARIDIRTPVRVTIEDRNIDLTYELPPEETEFKKKMESLIENVIVKEEVKKQEVINCNINFNTGRYNNYTGYDFSDKYYKNSNVTKQYDDDLIKIEKSHNGFYMDNDIVGDMATSEEEKASLECRNGNIIIKTGIEFEKFLIGQITNKDGYLKDYVKHFKLKNTDEQNKKKTFELHPRKKSYKILTERLVKLFQQYNRDLYNDAVAMFSNKKQTKNDNGITKEIKDNAMTLFGDTLVEVIFCDLITMVEVVWAGDCSGDVYDENNILIGTIETDEMYTQATFHGNQLIKIVNKIIDTGSYDVISDAEEEQ